MPEKPYRQAIYFFLFLALAYFPLFHQLDSYSFRMWDESIYAVNAFEMSQNHDFICRHYNGKAILWNPKPPLVTWMQVISFKIFGYSELSFRLPVALFCLLTVLYLIWYSKRELENITLGYLSAFVLITTPGYIHFHVARTGDPDGVLAFFVLAYCLIFYKWVEDHRDKKLFFLFAFLVFCAVFTKSFAGLVAMPALFLWATYRKKLKGILSQPFVYLGAFIVVSLLAGYYILHEIKTPGFIDSVLQKESGRYSSIVQHGEGVWFYLIKMWEEKFFPWIILLPISFALIYFEKNKAIKRFMLFIGLLSVMYLFVLSISKTKLIWYIAPVYPFLSILAAYSIFKLFQTVGLIGKRSIRISITAVVLLLLIYPYYVVADKVTNRKDKAGERYAYYITKLKESNPELKEYKIAISNLNPHVTYYRQYFNYCEDYNIKINFPRSIEVGDTVVSCDYISIDSITDKFDIKVLDSNRNCKCFVVKAGSGQTE